MEEAPADTGASADEDTQAWLEGVCRRTDEILWDSYRFALGVPGAAWPRIMFPQKGQARRVGEQEARFAFVAALLSDQDTPWALAAEVPTKLSYRFTHRAVATSAQRALTDLALYRAGHDEPALAIEFKAGGRSGKSEKDESIKKDLAKVLAEEPEALWFHVVRSANNATLQGLLHTLDSAISELSNPFKLSEYLAKGKTVRPRPKTITFHICVLNAGMTISIHRRLSYAVGKPEKEFFAIESTARGDSFEIADGQGWSVHRGAEA